MSTKKWQRDRPPLAPIGLSREDEAAFIGVSPAFFTQLVASGVMPKPKALGSRRIWNRNSIEQAWDRLPDVGEESRPDACDPWKDIAL